MRLFGSALSLLRRVSNVTLVVTQDRWATPAPALRYGLRRFLEKVIPNRALSPPFEKGGLGGILTGGVNPRGSNPPSPPFAKGGNGYAPFHSQAGKLFSGNRLKCKMCRIRSWGTVNSSMFSSPCRLLMPESKVPSGSRAGRPPATVVCRSNRPRSRRRRDTA